MLVVGLAFAGCAAQGLETDVDVSNAPAAYLWTRTQLEANAILLIEREDGRGSDLLPGIELTAAVVGNPGSGEQIVWSETATQEDRQRLADRAESQNGAVVWFLGVGEHWPWCATEIGSGDCPIVAELTHPTDEVWSLLERYDPQRLERLTGG